MTPIYIALQSSIDILRQSVDALKKRLDKPPSSIVSTDILNFNRTQKSTLTKTRLYALADGMGLLDSATMMIVSPTNLVQLIDSGGRIVKDSAGNLVQVPFK